MAGQIQLVLKGLEDTYLTGTPQITYFRTVFSNFDQFEIKYRENQFYATNVAFGKPQMCIIKKYGDIAKSNFLKVKLPSLFVTNSPSYVWCYTSNTAAQLRPNIYMYDKNYNQIKVLTTKDTCIYYNTAQSTWLPPGVTINLTTNKFNFSLECVYIGFDSKDEALFWGFKNYDSLVSYTKFKNSRYIFKNTSESEITLKSAGWVRQFSKYIRTYKPNVGSILIDKVEMFIGSQLIETIPGDYLSVYKDINVPEQLQKSLDSLEGADPKPSTSEAIYYVYLPISLKNIPICALSRQEVEIRISFNEFTTTIDNQYLNINEQFKVTDSLGETAYATIYDGSDVYFITQNGIVDKINFNKTIVPTSAIRANRDIYIATTDSNIIVYNTVTNTSNMFRYTDSYTVKPSIGLVYTTSLLNFTSNGIVQNIGTNLGEFLIDVTAIKNIYYFNTYIFLIFDTLIQVYKNDFTKIDEYTTNTLPYMYTSSPSTLYMISNTLMYTYSTTGFANTILPKQDPTAAVYKDALYLFYTNDVYRDSQRYPSIIDSSNTVTDVIMYNQTNQSVIVYTIGNFNGYKYKILGSADDYQTYNYDRPFLKIIQTNRTNIFIANNSIAYTTQFGTNTLNFGTILYPPVYTSYDGVSTVYVIDSTQTIQKIDLTSTVPAITTIQSYSISSINPKSLSYDGRFVYLFPSNGNTILIKYDTTKPFNSKESYISTSIIDSTTSQPKNMYINSTSFDGERIYALPSSSDGNIISYNTFDSTYTFIDFVKNGRDFSPQNITNSIIVQNDLFMISSNGFYRYHTDFSGTSITSAATSFSNAFLTVYDPLNSNVYIFSNNFSADGFMYIKTGSRDPTPTRLKPYTYQNTFTSYVNYGSLYYLVPSNSNVGVIVKQSDPINITTFSWPYTPNSSNTSVLVGSKLYMFPGPSSSNTIVYDIITTQSNVITTPKRNYKTATYYGNYVYLTDDSNIIRFNTTLDTFSDYSGYSSLSSNVKINQSDYITSNLANVYFVGSSIIRYDILANTYTEFNGTLIGNTIGTSTLHNSNIYILKDSGLLYISNITSTNIASKNDTPIDVTGNTQYIFTLFKDRLGRIDLSGGGDFHGTGYYTSTSVNRPVLGNVTATVELNGNIYSVFDSNSVTAYNGTVYSNANIASINIFTKAYTWFSNVIFLGNSFVMYETNNTLTTSNLVLTRFANTLSSFANADSYFYFTSKLSNGIIQYDFTNKSNLVYTPSNITGGFSETYNYNSNLFFFPYESNTIVSYATKTQNFQNVPDIINRVTWNGTNVISSHDNYILTDDDRIFKLTPTNTLGEFINHGRVLLNRPSLGYKATFQGLVNAIITDGSSPPSGTQYIDCDIYFYKVGNWTTTQPFEQPIGSQRTTFTAVTPGLYRNFRVYSDFTFTHTDGSIVNYKYFFLNGSEFSNTLPQISDQNYIVSSDARSLYNLDTGTYYGRYTTTSQYYPLYGSISVNSTSLDVRFQTTEQMARNFNQRVQTLFGNVFVTAQKIDSQFVNVIATRDTTDVTATMTIGTLSTPVPGSIVYRFQPNVPTTNTYNFSNVYSSQRFTYVFNSGSNDMIVFKNNTGYTGPLRSFPVPGNINTMIHQGIGTTTIVYMITDNYSNVYRFNEESDSSSYTNLNIVKTSSGSFSNASMFALTDGIGIVSDTTIYGFGIQNRFTNVYTQNITNPLSFNSNVNFFTVSGDKYIRAQLNKISDIQNAKYYEISLSPGAFKYAFADSKFMYIVKTGNVIYGDKFENITWDTKAFGKLSQDVSYIISSNTNNLILSYISTSRDTYKTYQYNKPSIFANTVQVYGNTAYMLPTSDSNIVSFNMDTKTFGFIQVSDFPVIYFSPNVCVTRTKVNNVSYTASNINAVVDDGRYVSISTPSNLIQFDYVSNIFLPNKSVYSNTAALSRSNVFFFSPTTVTSYSFNPRSYISTQVDTYSNGVQFYIGNVYFSSNTSVYRIDSNLQNLTVIAPANGNPGKSLLYNSNIAFSYSNSILAVDTVTGAYSSIKLNQNFSRFTVDPSNVFYTSMGMSISRGTVINSSIAFSPTFTNLGPVFYYGSNLYSVANDNTFVVYDSTSLPFSANAMFYSQNVSTVYTNKNIAYYPPGLNGNTLQIFDMSKQFFSGDAYTYIKVSNNNYKSWVTLSDSTYFIPSNSGNLINYFDGSEIRGYTVPGGTLTSIFDGQSIYLSNSTHVNRFYFTPLITSNAFGNAIYFTQTSTINNIIFDGASVYALGDVVYNINTSTISESDATGMFQDTALNILDRNSYTTGYFDGRFINFVRDTVKIYDVLPLVYPQFFSPSIITEYVYLSDRERNILQTRELKHIVKQIQTVSVPTNQYNRIDFWNPMSEIIINGDVSKFEVFLNGHEKVNCDGSLMSTIQILKHPRKPTRSNIFVYSFATNPNDEFPDAHVNMSRIRDKVFRIDSKDPSVNLYGITHNIVKFRDGLGGLVFNNSSQ